MWNRRYYYREKIKKAACWALIIILLPYIVTVFVNGPKIVTASKVDEMTIDVKGGGKMPVEKYCIGILARDMPAEYEEEALKAQAILVRTEVYRAIRDAGEGQKLEKEFWTEKQAIRDHAMILHSAYMCYEDTAVLFSAPSETGKSTQAGLWEKYRGTWTVNGDRSLLIREEDGWYANGWPVCGSSEICNNKSYPVRAIVMLSQAKENRISRLKGLEALRKVMEQITINAWNSEFQIQAMDELEILLKEVPVYHLECDISEDAVRCLEDVLAGGRGKE